MKNLIYTLVESGIIRSQEIVEAFLKISRKEFLPEESKHESGVNKVIAIGFGQTNSEPRVVANMLELLDVKPGQKILDVGSGSGWTTALLSYLVGKNGHVIALELIKELKEFGEKNTEKFVFVSSGRAEFYNVDGYAGLEKFSPYDRILVSAEVKSVPDALLWQLKENGKMVIPVNRSLMYIEKKGMNDFVKQEYSDYRFVPLVRKNITRAPKIKDR